MYARRSLGVFEEVVDLVGSECAEVAIAYSHRAGKASTIEKRFVFYLFYITAEPISIKVNLCFGVRIQAGHLL